MLGRKQAKLTARRTEMVRPFFNADWYLATYPDVAEVGVDPFEHYMSVGASEGRDPSPLFSNEFYLNSNPDLADHDEALIFHFLEAGGAEGRSPCALFDSQYYLQTYDDVRLSGMNPLEHYALSGGSEGRNTHLLFDGQFYLDTNEDVANSGENPLAHFLMIGLSQGRRPHPLFDPAYYSAQLDGNFGTYQDPVSHYLGEDQQSIADPHPLFDTRFFMSQIESEQPHGFNPLLHYIMCGPESTISPHPLFDQVYYRERRPELAGTHLAPLVDYIRTGAKDGVNPHALFHSWWYAKTYLGGQSIAPSPLEHFIVHGDRAGYNPNPYFMSDWYKSTFYTASDGISAPSNTLLHYIDAVDAIISDMNNNVPVRQVANPNPWFDTRWYLAEHTDVRETGQNPLAHYIETGHAEQRSPSPDFNTAWYASTYAEIAPMEPLLHFLEGGAKEGRAPNAEFFRQQQKAIGDPDVAISYDRAGNARIDPRQYKLLEASGLFDRNWYRDHYLTPSGNTADPIEHYLIFGANLGYNPGPNFNSKAYRSNNHDLRSAAINPLLHYIQHGRFEGRHATKEKRDNEIEAFRFSPAEYGPITDILAFDSKVSAPEISETVCLHLHLFHTDMAEEFVGVINRLTIPFTLLISVQNDEDPEKWSDYFASQIKHAERVIVKTCINRGRDVQPWLIEFKDVIQDHDIFCHLHTKKSGYNKFQRSWRRYLAHTMFGETTLVNQILNIFASDPSVGLIFPAYFYILRDQPNYGKNFDHYERLYATLFGDLPDETCPDYPAGSFFWARTAMLEPLFSLELQVDDFDEEGGQVDGTMAHALERILGTLPAFTGHSKRCVGVDIPYDLTRYIHPARVETLNESLYLPSSFDVEKSTEQSFPDSTVPGSASDALPIASTKKRPRIAVYSAITGGYENFVRPLTIDPDIDYYLFTDTPEKFNPDWATVVEIPYVSHKPVRTARYAKTHPHFWFPDYDYAVWMDANVLPVHSLWPLIDQVEGTGYDAAFIQHPLRYNCMEEGSELIKMGIDDQKLIEEQLTRYGQIPEIFGEELIETNLFICRPQMAVTKAFCNTWWSELNNYSHRDQLSINYAILQSNLKWMPLFEDNVSLRDQPDFFLLEHEMHNRSEFIRKISAKMNIQPMKQAS